MTRGSGPLRREILRFMRDDGGIDLLDPLLDRLHRLDAREAAALDDPDDALYAKLERALLVDGPIAEALRERAWAARTSHPSAPDAAATAADWSLAARLPPQVAAEWREPERCRRMAEDRAAGREVLMLRAFLDPGFADALAGQASALPLARLETEVVRAWRNPLLHGELEGVRALLHDPVVREILGGILGVPLPARTVRNVWRLDAGDRMDAHPDGRAYAATFVLGLAIGWTAADGGAVAFGKPVPGGFRVRERFVPHLGDLCVFVPSPESWHVVEPVRNRTRLTLSGWWLR